MGAWCRRRPPRRRPRGPLPWLQRRPNPPRPRPPRLRNRSPRFRRRRPLPRRPLPRHPPRSLPLRSQNRKPRRNWRRSNPRNPRRKKKRTRAMRRDGQRLASGDAEGAQGASVDVQAGDPDDQEPAADPAVDRDHEDRGRFPRRDRTRGHRDRSVPVHVGVRPARCVCLDAPDPDQDRGLHRVPVAPGTEPGDLPEMRRTTNVTSQGETSGWTTCAVSIVTFRERRNAIRRMKFGSSSQRWARREMNAAPRIRGTIARTPFERSYTFDPSFGAEKNGKVETVPVAPRLAYTPPFAALWSPRARVFARKSPRAFAGTRTSPTQSDRTTVSAVFR